MTTNLPRGIGVLALALVVSCAGAARAETIAKARDNVITQTLAYLNIPYLWGGEHPQTGLDCSGFVQLVFRKAGLELPRVARDQFSATDFLPPSRVLPGDLVFFAMKHPGTARVDHVGIYLGKGYFIHASFTNGIHVEPITKPYYQDRLVGIRKYSGF